MRRALLLAAALVSGASAAASANPLPPVPVHVYHDGDGATCAYVSEQTPHCLPPISITK